jgi:hypothetical protein
MIANPLAVSNLSRLELDVVALARRKSERTTGLRGSRAERFIGLLLKILGKRAVGPLANTRLETLRRLAAALYHRSDRVAATITYSLAAGLTTRDIAAVRAVVEGSLVASKRSPFLTAGIAASTVVLVERVIATLASTLPVRIRIVTHA